MASLFVITSFYTGYHLFIKTLYYLLLPLTVGGRINYFICSLLLFCACILTFRSIQNEGLSLEVLIRDLIFFISIPLAANSRSSKADNVLRAGYIFATLHASTIICISVVGTWQFFQSVEQFIAFRSFFILSGIGDVYTFGSGFVRVQLLGNPLLFLFSILNVSEWFYNQKKLNLVILAGLFVAGNLSFIIAFGFCFIVMFCLKLTASYRVKLSHLFILVSSPIIITLLVIFLYGFLLTKIGGDTSSLGHRYMLFKAFSDELSLLIFLFGEGFGARLWLEFLDTHANYIEVQHLLLVYKFGLPIYILWNVLILSGLCTSKRIFFIYFCFCLGTVTNPYVFDANQLMCVFLLRHLKFSPIISSIQPRENK